MKNLFRAAAIALFVSASACLPIEPGVLGSQTDALSKSFDPVTQFAAVKKAAQQYTSNVVAVSLNGERQASASTSSTATTSFVWVWTVMGDNGIFVDVQINSSSVKVLNHEQRFLYAGEAVFNPSNVLVNGQDLLAISATLGLGQPTQITLSSSLASQLTGPRWDVTYPNNGYMTIDGVTGEASK